MSREEIVTKVMDVLNDLDTIKSNRLKAEVILYELNKFGIQYAPQFSGDQEDEQQ